MELYKKLGFNSEYEQNLYEDVCCGLNNIKGLTEKEDAEKLLKRLNNIKVYTKKDYEEYIEKNGLQELFDKVKGMSYLDRYVELYVYHANCFAVHNNFSKLGIKYITQSDSNEDGEEIIRRLNLTTDEIDKSTSHLHCIKYIFSQVNAKIPFLEDMFYLSISSIQNKVFLNEDGEENSPKLS